jgi:hypothetical protein
MKHPTIEDFAGFFSNHPDAAEVFGRHLAAVCPDCGERLAAIEALLRRFRHWDPAIAVGEGLEADALLDGLLAAGEGFAAWWPEVEQRGELMSWGVATVALERAAALLSGEAARPRARELALLAAAIAENLGPCYHVDWIHDLKALAYATVFAAGSPAEGDPREAARARLRHALAATEALDKGTGSESLAAEVWGLLSRGGPP